MWSCTENETRILGRVEWGGGVIEGKGEKKVGEGGSRLGGT